MSRLKRFFTSGKWKGTKKSWYKFSRNPLSIIGLAIGVLALFLAIFAPYIAPFPGDAERFMYNPDEANLPPSWRHLCGTDEIGRDIFSRIIFGLRYSLMMVGVVLALVTPSGVALGIMAGYFKGTWIDTVIMRVSDVFICVPTLVLAMSVSAVTTPNVFTAMMAVSLMWWPWFCRLAYGMASSLRNEPFVQAAEVAGAKTYHILYREILPNCLGSILTKMTLDAGWVVLIGASLSFLGLGAPLPTPDLGTMVASGAKFLPGQWWKSTFPAMSIVLLILGFNLLGDGVRDLFAAEEL